MRIEDEIECLIQAGLCSENVGKNEDDPMMTLMMILMTLTMMLLCINCCYLCVQLHMRS